jgi:hypothetical protein
MALDFQKVAGHLVQLLLNVISSAHCRLHDLLRIFTHFTPLELELAGWFGLEPSPEAGAAVPPMEACQRSFVNLDRPSPIGRACASTTRWEARSCSPAVPSPCHSEHDATGSSRSTTDTHGPLTLEAPYYRCAATRMVRMGSLTLADDGDVISADSVFSRIGPEHTSHGMDVVLRIPLPQGGLEPVALA